MVCVCGWLDVCVWMGVCACVCVDGVCVWMFDGGIWAVCIGRVAVQRIGSRKRRASLFVVCLRSRMRFVMTDRGVVLVYVFVRRPEA